MFTYTVVPRRDGVLTFHGGAGADAELHTGRTVTHSTVGTRGVETKRGSAQESRPWPSTREEVTSTGSGYVKVERLRSTSTVVVGRRSGGLRR